MLKTNLSIQTRTDVSNKAAGIRLQTERTEEIKGQLWPGAVCWEQTKPGMGVQLSLRELQSPGSTQRPKPGPVNGKDGPEVSTHMHLRPPKGSS